MTTHILTYIKLWMFTSKQLHLHLKSKAKSRHFLSKIWPLFLKNILLRPTITKQLNRRTMGERNSWAKYLKKHLPNTKDGCCSVTKFKTLWKMTGMVHWYVVSTEKCRWLYLFSYCFPLALGALGCNFLGWHWCFFCIRLWLLRYLIAGLEQLIVGCCCIGGWSATEHEFWQFSQLLLTSLWL